MSRIRWEKLIFIGITIIFVAFGLILLSGKHKKLSVEEASRIESENSVEEDLSRAVKNKQGQDIKQESKEKITEILVHVDGAVNKPGLYKFSEGDRINQAIEKAGGIKEKADLSQINLASKLVDEMKIYVPIIGEKAITDNNVSAKKETNDNNSNKININKASVEELISLPSIGPSRAKDIIDYRESGLFQNIEELKNIPGIGEKTFDKLKDKVCLN